MGPTCIVNLLKFSNISYLPKRPRQTVQTQIRLLLKKQSDQGLHCLLFQTRILCLNWLPAQITNILFAIRKRKVLEILKKTQNCVMLSYSRCVFCCSNSVVKVYSTASGECVRELNGHKAAVTGLAINPNNSLQVCSGQIKK